MTVWIPCKSNMPDDDTDVLFVVLRPYDKQPKVLYGRHHTNKARKGWWSNFFGAFMDYEVPWWMPLPSTEGLKNA